MHPLTPSTALAAVLVDELERAGLTDACLAPGSRSAPLAMALHEHPRVALHVTIDERSAAFLALGIARATRRPVAVVSTSGTAAANFHPAVIEAHQSRVGLLVLTADRPPELRDTAANQTIDQVRLYGPAVRWFVEVGVPEARPDSVAYWRSVASRAWAEAAGPSAGPVHANLAFREPLVPVPGGEGFPHSIEGRADGRPWTRTVPAHRAPAGQQVERLAAAIATAERGLLVAGDADVDPEPIVRLAAVAGWPLLAEPTSGARAGANAISAYHALLGNQRFAREHRPDLVVRIGTPELSKSLAALLDASVPHVVIDTEGAWLDPRRTVSEIVAADPAATCAAVGKILPERGGSAWLESWRAGEARAREAIDDVLDAEDVVSEPRTARDVADALPDGATLVVASSMPIRDLNATMRPRRGLRVLANRGASGIDGFVSTALGVALGAGGQTVALAGDLSALHDQNGFLTDVDVDLALVVVNNDGGGIFSFLPQASFPESFERLFGTPHGIDFERYAALYGLAYHRVGGAGDLVPAMAEVARRGGRGLVEVRTGRAENVALHRRMQAAVDTALAG